MYHKINVPDCAPLLMRLTEIAGKAIEFALSNDLSTLGEYNGDGKEQKGLAKSLGEEFLAAHGDQQLLTLAKESFLAHFAEWDRPEVGKWLWRKYANIAAPIVRLLVIPLVQKGEVLKAFNHDTDLDGILACPEPKVFHFGKLGDNQQQAQTLIKELLVGFYESLLVDQGIEAEVLGEEESLDHQEILRSYRKANLQLKVCPGCDGDPPLSVSAQYYPRSDGKPHHSLWLNANIDHFFPKSKYPFLAVHPLNLVPLCTVCNQVRKGDNDPMEPDDVIDLDDIYHPYIRGAHGEVVIIVERDKNDNQPYLYFYSTASVPHADARLHSLEHVLGLQNYWNGDLQDERLEIEVESALRNAIQDEREADERYIDDWLRAKIARIGHNMTYDISRRPRMVASQAFATWLATDEQAQDERVRLFNKALGTKPGAVNPAQQQIHPGPVS